MVVIPVASPKNLVSYQRPIKLSMSDKTHAKTYRGYLSGYLQKARQLSDDKLRILCESLINNFLEAYDRYHSKAIVKLPGQYGKSDMRFMIKPDFFEVYVYRGGKEICRKIPKEEVNVVIKAINMTNKHEEMITKRLYCETEQIAGNYCRIANINFNKKENPMFHDNGEFEWQHFFGDRYLHTQLNFTLRLLAALNAIEYTRGKISVLGDISDVQTRLQTL